MNPKYAKTVADSRKLLGKKVANMILKGLGEGPNDEFDCPKCRKPAMKIIDGVLRCKICNYSEKYIFGYPDEKVEVS